MHGLLTIIRFMLSLIRSNGLAGGKLASCFANLAHAGPLGPRVGPHRAAKVFSIVYVCTNFFWKEIELLTPNVKIQWKTIDPEKRS